MTATPSQTARYSVLETTEHEVTVDLGKLPDNYDLDTDPEGLLDQLIADGCSTNNSFVCVHNREFTHLDEDTDGDPTPQQQQGTTATHSADGVLTTVWSILDGDGSAADMIQWLHESIPQPQHPSLARMTPQQRQASVWGQGWYDGSAFFITGMDEGVEHVCLTALDGGHSSVPFNEVTPDPELPRMKPAQEPAIMRPGDPDDRSKPMTVRGLIAELGKVPESTRDLPIYLCDLDNPNLWEVKSVSTWDWEEPHSKDNQLSINTSTSGDDW